MKYLSLNKLLLIIASVAFAALFSAFQSQSGAFCPFVSNSSGTVSPDPYSPAGNTQFSTAGNGFTQAQDLQDAPDFTLETMEGDAFTLSDHEGKVVVLNIWATWCPPCRKEIPDLIEIQEEMKEKGVLVLGISVDEEGWQAVRPFAEDYDFNYPLVVDDGIVDEEYGPFRGIPTTFIINKKGQVEYVAPGMVTREMLQPALEELAAR